MEKCGTTSGISIDTAMSNFLEIKEPTVQYQTREFDPTHSILQERYIDETPCRVSKMALNLDCGHLKEAATFVSEGLPDKSLPLSSIAFRIENKKLPAT